MCRRKVDYKQTYPHSHVLQYEYQPDCPDRTPPLGAEPACEITVGFQGNAIIVRKQ